MLAQLAQRKNAEALDYKALARKIENKDRAKQLSMLQAKTELLELRLLF